MGAGPTPEEVRAAKRKALKRALVALGGGWEVQTGNASLNQPYTIVNYRRGLYLQADLIRASNGEACLIFNVGLNALAGGDKLFRGIDLDAAIEAAQKGTRPE